MVFLGVWGVWPLPLSPVISSRVLVYSSFTSIIQNEINHFIDLGMYSNRPQMQHVLWAILKEINQIWKPKRGFLFLILKQDLQGSKNLCNMGYLKVHSISIHALHYLSEAKHISHFLRSRDMHIQLIYNLPTDFFPPKCLFIS